MPRDPVVHFYAYRRQEEVRKSANSAMMGLLAGSRIAEHFLSLTEGCEHLLPTIFPTVDHIQRFNLTSGKAREVLQNADTYLGTMAVPYALAIHEDFLRTCVMLTGAAANGISAAGLHS